MREDEHAQDPGEKLEMSRTKTRESEQEPTQSEESIQKLEDVESQAEENEKEEKEDEDAKAPDMALQLTCSMRSVSRRQYELENPPDGGARAWLQVFGGHATVFCTWGFINSFGVFQAYYIDTLGVSPSAISWIGSIQVFLLFFLGTFTGRALDAGYFFTVYRIGSVLIILGIFLTSLGTQYWHIFLSQGLLAGLGNGLVFCPTMALCSTYFKEKRSLAIGIVASGSATGGIIIPLMASKLLPTLGFAKTLQMLGIVVIVLLAVANLVLRPRVHPRKTGGIVDWTAFKERSYSAFAAGMFLVFLGLYFAFFYLSAYAQNRLGQTQTTAFNTLIIMNAVGLPGRIIPNYIAGSVGPLNILAPFCAAVGILLLFWQLVGSYGGLVAWACMYGIVAAGVQSMFPATLSSLTTDLSKAGVRMGMIFSIVSFACLTGSPIGGALIERAGGGYTGGQVFAGVVVLVGSACLVCARREKTGRWWGGTV